jgi:hypothetical protein
VRIDRANPRFTFHNDLKYDIPSRSDNDKVKDQKMKLGTFV